MVASGESYPIVLTGAFWQRQGALVVGGGVVAERKIKNLVAAVAQVRVIAPTLTPNLQVMAAAGEFEWLARKWQMGDVLNYPQALLVFAATNSTLVNGAVSAEARAAGRLLNRADDPADCDFILPGVVRAGEITVTVTTSSSPPAHDGDNTGEAGVSPALTAHLRQKIAQTIGQEYSELAVILRQLRPYVKAHVAPPQRATLWREMVNSPALALLRAGQHDEAQALLHSMVEQNLAA